MVGRRSALAFFCGDSANLKGKGKEKRVARHAIRQQFSDLSFLR